LAKKKPVSPEVAAQAAAMKKRLDELAKQRQEREAEQQRGANAGGGWSPGGVDPQQIRSGRRGNR
jgi:hypothetical protein